MAVAAPACQRGDSAGPGQPVDPEQLDLRCDHYRCHAAVVYHEHCLAGLQHCCGCCGHIYDDTSDLIDYP